MYFLVGRQEMISNFWLMEKWENFIQHFQEYFLLKKFLRRNAIIFLIFTRLL